MKLNAHFFAVLGAAVTINAMAQKTVTLTQADLRSGVWKTDVAAGETLDVTLAADVTSIPADAFADAPVARVDGTPARRLTKVGAYAFARCKELRELLLPESVTTMGEGCFRECESLERLTVPSGVTELPRYMCVWCTGLKEVTLPPSLHKVGRFAFQYCSSLQSVTFPATLTTLGMNSFAYCFALKEVEVPSSVRQLEAYAFSECTSLRRAKLPGNSAELGELIFDGCRALEVLEEPSAVPPKFECASTIFDSEEGAMYRKCRLVVPASSEDRYRFAPGWNLFYE